MLDCRNRGHTSISQNLSTGVASIREGSESNLYKAPASLGVVGQLSPAAEEELH